MAKTVHAQIAGGEVQTLRRATDVGDVREKLKVAADYAATVNGEPADDEDELDDKDMVTFAPKVKGGCY